MSSIPAASVPTRTSPLARVGHWCGDALRLWRRAPLMLVWLSLCCMLVEVLLQLIPWAGVPISKVVVPMCMVGIWIGLDGVQHGERLRFSSLWAGWRHPRWIALWVQSAVIGLLVFGFQTACAWLAYGNGVIDAVVFGHMAAHRELATRAFEYALLLPGELPSALLLLATPLLLFRGASIAASIRIGIRIVFAMPLAFGLLILLQMALFAVSLLNAWTLILLVAVFQPWSSALSYAVWHAIATELPDDAAA